MMRFFERWMVFPAPRGRFADWVAADLPHEDVYFTVEDGTRLHGWYVPHPAPRASILFSHGNGENVARLAKSLGQLRERVAVSIFAWDYRSYGRSRGKPHEANVLADARAAQLWLDHKEGAGRTAALDRVHEDSCIVPIQQCASQVEAADSKVHHADSFRQRALCQSSHDLDAEAIVSEKEVANPGNKKARRGHGSSFLPGKGSTS